jgi:hypothetical protein
VLYANQTGVNVEEEAPATRKAAAQRGKKAGVSP